MPTDETLTEAVLVCGECGRISLDRADGWRMYLDDDDEPVPYCPECAEREFGRR